MSEETKYKYVDEDFEKIRNELYLMLEDAREALSIAKDILENSEHPRAVETYSGLLKNVATINSQILDLTKTYKEIKEKGVDRRRELESDPSTTNNNLFIGSTKELQSLLKGAGVVHDITPTMKEIKDNDAD